MLGDGRVADVLKICLCHLMPRCHANLSNPKRSIIFKYYRQANLGCMGRYLGILRPSYAYIASYEHQTEGSTPSTKPTAAQPPHFSSCRLKRTLSRTPSVPPPSSSEDSAGSAS